MHNFKINSIYLPKINLISLSSFELCCPRIYNRHTHTHIHTYRHIHTYTQTFSRKRIFLLRELRNHENHGNLGVEKFHLYKAFSLRKQKVPFNAGSKMCHLSARLEKESSLRPVGKGVISEPGDGSFTDLLQFYLIFQ